MLEAALAFLPFAAFLAVLPGPATAIVIQTAASGGQARAVRATLGDATGLAIWAAASMLGVSALVVASEAAFVALKTFGAIVLVAYGVTAIRRARRHEPAALPELPRRGAFRLGLLTALSNPKVGLFYIALLPQFVPAGAAVLPATLLLAGIQISLSCAWYLVLASAVSRIRDAFARQRRRIEAATGVLMVAFGLRILADR
ncbi:MAG TPA: LysE family transporter [Solirubrobacteraceae bacterium]|nr:LysE family transporter [Solirubrobacteraceae bacterium]